MKEHYHEAQIVSKDYYKVYLTDFVPYLEKIKVPGAEVIFTLAFQPDAGNLVLVLLPVFDSKIVALGHISIYKSVCEQEDYGKS